MLQDTRNAFRGLRPSLAAKTSIKLSFSVDINGVFDNKNKCLNCEHCADSHWVTQGTDGNRRIFCRECPQHKTRLMGDEGKTYPMPFFAEMSFGFQEPCFREGSSKIAHENVLPPSPQLAGPQILRLSSDSTEEEDLTLTGVAWPVSCIESLEPGDEIRHNFHYKCQLYWDQEGFCPGCNELIRFDNMELDRICPGRKGGEYVVGNVQLLCSSCNRIKGDRGMSYLLERRKSQGFDR